MKYTATLFLALWNTFCLSLVGLGWSFGIIQPVFANDRSHVTLIIASLMVVVLVQTTYQTFRMDRLHEAEHSELVGRTSLVVFLKNEVLVILGICGTLLGILMITTGSTVDAGSPEAVAASIQAANEGMHTGVGASLVAMVCKLWSESIFFIKSTRLRELGWF